MLRSSVLSVFAALVLVAFAGCKPAKEVSAVTPAALSMYIGVYTNQTGPSGVRAAGIYRIQVDSAGKLTAPLHIDSGLINPSFVTLSADGRFLYAVEETGAEDADSTGHIRSFRVSPEGLIPINRQSTHGFYPCHVQVDRQNQFVFVANYGGGIAMYPLSPDGGVAPSSAVQYHQAKGPHPRQDASHPHSVFLNPEETFLYVPDLGADRIYIYQIDRVTGKLLPAAQPYCSVAAGAGPRHVCFHPKLPIVYVINELNSTITRLKRDSKTGQLDVLESVSTLPADFQGTSLCADIHISADGNFLYGSNRGHNSLACFTVDARSGQLTPNGHVSTQGDYPRNFAISPDGQWLLAANQKSDNLSAYRIQPNGGLDFKWSYTSPTPVCIQFYQPRD